MKSHITKMAITLAVSLMLIMSTASADIVFSNYPDNGVYGGWCSEVALGFTVPQGADYQLNSVRIGLRHMIDDSVTLNIYSDNAGQPGEVLQSIGTRIVRKHHTYSFNSGSIALKSGRNLLAAP